MDNSKLPAYPSPEFLGDSGLGLTKLERFTMAAMQGLAANPEYMAMCKRTDSHFNSFAASAAVALAQSTLSELSKHQ